MPAGGLGLASRPAAQDDVVEALGAPLFPGRVPSIAELVFDKLPELLGVDRRVSRNAIEEVDGAGGHGPLGRLGTVGGDVPAGNDGEPGNRRRRKLRAKIVDLEEKRLGIDSRR